MPSKTRRNLITTINWFDKESVRALAKRMGKGHTVFSYSFRGRTAYGVCTTSKEHKQRNLVSVEYRI